ncbi:MAG TPA: hypothetical protein VFA33_21710 [Bryobacteraceae bacterium]|nr:hypothetical protein [Bryobacteraceae bacterium]
MRITVGLLVVGCVVWCGSPAAFGQQTTMGVVRLEGTTDIGIAAPSASNAAVSSRGHRAKPFLSPKNRSLLGWKASGLSIPAPPPSPVVSPGPNFAGFNGLTDLNQVAAGTGIYFNSQLDVEPPDQALAAGNGFVVEGVNLAIAAYSAKTGILVAGPTPFNEFFHMPPEFPTNAPPGPFLSDPRVYFDSMLQRWFVTILEIDVNPDGSFGRSHVEIAVSRTSTPVNGWLLYSIDTTDDGQNGTPSNPGCPCFGDQPLMGADSNGFYISTNEFSLNPFGAYFNGAQVYALSKLLLAAGKPFPFVHFYNLTATGNPAYSIQPATTPPGAMPTPGVEYLFSSLDFNGTLDNQLAVWAITNTGSLTSPTPQVHLLQTIVQSEVYGQPPNVQQKPGPIPLGLALGDPIAMISSNDDRMNQAVYSNGLLWGAVNTIVQGPGGSPVCGVAYFGVLPFLSGGQLSALMVKQGYVAAGADSVIFPSVAVLPPGTSGDPSPLVANVPVGSTVFRGPGPGVMVFTLAGPDYYPSAAYVDLDAVNGTGNIVLAAQGVLPEDGFTGYPQFYPPPPPPAEVARWGDYSAATADAQRGLWIATEYIPPLSRTLYANWGTFIGRVQH